MLISDPMSRDSRRRDSERPWHLSMDGHISASVVRYTSLFSDTDKISTMTRLQVLSNDIQLEYCTYPDHRAARLLWTLWSSPLID